MITESLLTLAGVPLGLVTNLTSDRINSFLETHDFLAEGLDDIFVEAFLRAIKRHKKSHDSTAQSTLDSLAKKIKRNKSRFLKVFSGPETIRSLGNESYVTERAEMLAQEYTVGDCDLTTVLIKDCLHDYLHCFFAHVSERQAMSIMITELFKCNDSLDDAAAVLAQLKATISVDDFSTVRDSVLGHVTRNHEEYKRALADYDDYVQAHFRDLPLRGYAPRIGGALVAMKLEDIYVPLRLDKEKVEPGFSIRYSLEGPVMDEALEVDTLLSYKRTVLLGKPGSGKSTTLKHMAVTASQRHANPGTSGPVPILFRVAEYAEQYKETHVPLHEYLCAQAFESKFQWLIDVTLRYSDALLLVDGLDEVTDKALRLQVVAKIEDFLDAYSNCQCIVSSRIIGYDEVRLGPGFAHFQLDDFSASQIRMFTECWTSAIHEDWTQAEIDREAAAMNAAICAHDSVFRLATNPLLMTIIAMIYFRDMRLPNRRVALYEYSTETFLENWVLLRVGDESKLKSREDIIEILSPIAFYMHRDRADSQIPESELRIKFQEQYLRIHTRANEDIARRETSEFIKFLREQAGFFYEVVSPPESENLFGFMHGTFEEYFAGMYVANDFNNGGNLWHTAIYKSRWTEVLRLAAAHLSVHMGREKTTEFIRAIMGVRDDFPELGRREILLCRIFSDDITVTDDCRQDFIQTVVDFFSQDVSGPLRDGRTVKEGVGFESLFRSNVGNDFWLACFDRARALDANNALAGLLLDVIVDSGAPLDESRIKLVRQYLDDMPMPDLARIVARQGSVRLHENNMSNLLYASFCDRLPEATTTEFEVILPIMRGIIFPKTPALKWVMIFSRGLMSSMANTANYNRVKALVLGGILVYSYTPEVENVLPHGFLTKDDNAWLRRVDYHEESDFRYSARYITCSAVPGKDNCLWVIHVSLDHFDHLIGVTVFNATTREEVVIPLDPHPSTSNIPELGGLPPDVRKCVIAHLLEFVDPGEASRHLFDRLLALGLDDISPYWWLKYIRAHVHEDARLEQAFLISRHYSRYSPVNVRTTAECLAMPFSYKPSSPMQALIQRAHQTPISLDLLKQVQQFALMADEPLKTAALSLLGELVNQGDNPEEFRFE
ncbi:MAG: NACHT domain-containing protein [Propionibacteriaceae bacterium]|nr:NACHT domain-containing protein [Propionibacteriaceae bacterium]